MLACIPHPHSAGCAAADSTPHPADCAAAGFSSITLYALIVVVGCIITRSWQVSQAACSDSDLGVSSLGSQEGRRISSDACRTRCDGCQQPPAIASTPARLLFGSLQALHSATYDWSLVRPFTGSMSFLDALPILAFGFQVCCLSGMLVGRPGFYSRAAHFSLSFPSHMQLCCPSLAQCHTNLAAVFHELEDEPDLFGSAANLAGIVARAGAASPVAGAAAGSAAGNGSSGGNGSSTERQAQQAQQVQREERVVLLRNPPRRFVRPVQRTQKLLGMVQVLCASSESRSHK